MIPTLRYLKWRLLACLGIDPHGIIREPLIPATIRYYRSTRRPQ